MSTDAMREIREALASHRWATTTPFSTRLGDLRRLLQERFDRLPAGPAFTARVPIVLAPTLDELVLILPPTERRLLDHVRARRPLRDLLGTRGFHNVSRLNTRLQRVLGRVQAYCGSVVRHRLVQPYDRPGHDHHRRPGRPRRLRPRDHFPALRVWVPCRYAIAKGYPFEETEGGRTREERRRAVRRLLRSQIRPDQDTSLRRIEPGRG
jgi:hypothetical protein